MHIKIWEDVYQFKLILNLSNTSHVWKPQFFTCIYVLMSFIPPPSLVNWLPFIIISFNLPNCYWNSMNILNISCATEKYCCNCSPPAYKSIYNRLVIKSLYNKYLRCSILLVCILQILRFILILVTLQTIKFIIIHTIKYANLCFCVWYFFLGGRDSICTNMDK